MARAELALHLEREDIVSLLGLENPDLHLFLEEDPRSQENQIKEPTVTYTYKGEEVEVPMNQYLTIVG